MWKGGGKGGGVISVSMGSSGRVLSMLTLAGSTRHHASKP